jgi:hypothetical protein
LLHFLFEDHVGEADFRYSYRVKLGYGDEDRAAVLAKGITGKRLTYRRPYKESSTKTP